MKAKHVVRDGETVVNGHGALRLARFFVTPLGDERPADEAFHSATNHGVTAITMVTAYLRRWRRVTDAAEVAAATRSSLPTAADMVPTAVLCGLLEHASLPLTAAWIRHWAPVIAEIERVPEPEDWTEVEA